MSEITEKIKKELLIRCEKSKQESGFDIWNNHIKYVVENAIELAKEYGADVEIKEWVRKKLERDYNKLSPRTRDKLKDRYINIMNVLFVN